VLFRRYRIYSNEAAGAGYSAILSEKIPRDKDSAGASGIRNHERLAPRLIFQDGRLHSLGRPSVPPIFQAFVASRLTRLRQCTLPWIRRVALLPANEYAAQGSHERAPEIEEESLSSYDAAGFGLQFRFRRRKKLTDHHLGCATDYALADLYERSANLNITQIFHERLVAIFFEQIEKSDAAHEALLALAVDDHLVVLGCPNFFQLELAGIHALDPGDTDVDRSGKLVGRELIELFAARDESRKTFRAVEEIPYALA
jgi:hypothetical protein